MSSVYRIGRFELRPADAVLLDGGESVPLGGRAMDMLCVLAERAPGLVTKRELLERVWPNLVVEENNLPAQIVALRRVLGAGAIVTVSGRGYRLAGAEKSGTGKAARPAVAAPARPPQFPLLERAEALGELNAALERAKKGDGSVCLVYGEAGIGKTSLCDAFASSASGARVLRGICEALFSPRPLGPLHDIAEALGPAVRDKLDAAGDRAVLFAAVSQALQVQTTVWLIEDLHWADAATLDLVKFLARRIAGSNLLLVLTHRDDELAVDHPLRLLLGDLPAKSTRIALPPLSADGVARLAHEAGRDCEGILGATGGNPFYVTELLEAGGLPPTVRDAVNTRVARQSAGTRALLELVALEPGRIENWLVDALGPWSDADVEDALASGLLVADGAALSFRHELARLAVEQTLAPLRARRLHARLLEAIAGSGHRIAAYARYVHHAKAAELREEVLRYAPLAAAQAADRGAHGEAAALFEAAIDALGKGDAAHRGELLGLYCDELNLMGRDAAAIPRREEELAIWRNLGRKLAEGHALRRLSRHHWVVGHGREALEHAEAALSVLAEFPEHAEYGWALGVRSQLLMLRGRNREAIEVGRRAFAIAERVGDENLVAHVLNNIGTGRIFLGEEREGMADLQRSLAIATGLRDDEQIARAYINMSTSLCERRRYDECLAVVSDAERFFSTRDIDNVRSYLQGWLSRLYFERGDWRRARSLALGVIELKPHPLAQIWPLLVEALLRAYRGEPGGDASLERATAIATQTGELQRIAPAAHVRLEILWLRGAAPKDAATYAAMYEEAVAIEARHLHEELGFWLWRHGVSPLAPPDLRNPYGLLRAGRWREAAASFRAAGCPLREAQALADGDAASRERAAEMLRALGAAGP